MALFKQVTLHDVRKSFVNLDAVTHIEETKDNLTSISFDSDNYIFVTETPAQIMSGLHPDPIFARKTV